MGQVSTRSRAVFFRCLATLFESGVPLVRSFELLGEQTEDVALARASQEVARQLVQGKTPAESMLRHPGCFQALHIALVKVGQRSGALGQVFSRLARDEEQKDELHQRLRATLGLPLVVVSICLVLITFVAPLVLGSVVQNLGLPPDQIPWITRLMVAVSSLFRQPWFWILVGTGGMAGLGLQRSWQTEPRYRLQIAQWLDRLPGIGWVLRLQAVTQFLRTLETTISVGFPLMESLKMSEQAAHHPFLAQQLPRILEAVQAGEELHSALNLADFFPPVVIQGIKAGQESGSLSLMLRNLSKILQVELDHACETFSRALEPLVIGVVGAVVGVAVVATLLPMVKLVDSL